MNKNLLIITLLLFNIGLFAQQKMLYTDESKYSSDWEKVEQMEKENLPKSAYEIADKILQQAIADKNTPQVIKALILKNKYNIAIDSDNNTEIFKDLENLLNQSISVSDKALLHSMLAELYLKYYNNNSWTINSRSELTDYIPEDIKEWPKNIFYDKAINHFNLSVNDKDALLNVKKEDYKDIIYITKYSDEYYPTLYDFIMYRNIILSNTIIGNFDFDNQITTQGLTWANINGLAEVFTKVNLGNNDKDYNLLFLKLSQQYMLSLLERNMPETLVFMETKKTSLLKGKSSTYDQKYRLEILSQIYKKYKSYPEVVETISVIADCYVNKYTDNKEEESENRATTYKWLTDGLKQYSNYKRKNILKKPLYDLVKPEAIVSDYKSIFYSGNKDKNITLRYKSVGKVTVDISKKEGKDKYIPFKKYAIELSPKTPYLFYEQEINIDISETGTYKVDLSFDKPIKENSPFEVTITNLASFSRISGEKDYEFYIVDRLDSKPIKGAIINILREDTVIKTLQTNNQGFASYSSEINLNSDYTTRNKYQYEVFTKEDNSLKKYRIPYSYMFQGNNNREEVISGEKINIFTDRSIYRPGQVVYYKAVVVKSEGESLTLLSKKTYTVKLYDINHQIVAEETLSTNEFGSIAGQFSLPTGRSTGMYSIEVGDNSEYINVEEYKRPTFQITFDKIDKTYSFGDKVTVTGHVENFSGVKVQDAKVEYTISKNEFWRWRGSSEHIENGNVTSKSDGSFDITFTIPQNTSKAIPFWRNIYSFNISASVTDINGETQSGEYNFAVGDVSMMLSTTIPDKLDKKATEKFEIKASNLNGQDISTSGTYTIYKDTTKIEVLKGDFSTGEQSLLRKQLLSLPSGQYTIRLQAKDDNGKDVETESTFVLYSYDDKKPPIESNDWSINKNTLFDINKPAEILLGISSKNITVLYELIRNEKIFSRQQVKFNNENKTFTIPYKAEYEEGVYAVFTYIIEGNVYQKRISLNKVKEEKELKLKLEVFRDKLRPGQKEEWRISVKDNQGKPAFAELLASMYDTSLDKIRQTNNWSFSNLGSTTYHYPIGFSLDNANSYIYSRYTFNDIKFRYPAFFFDRIKWFGFDFNDKTVRIRGMSSASNLVLQENRVLSKTESVEGGLAAGYVNFTVPILQDEAEEVRNKVKEEAPQIRQNFSETAFFYPQLKTDENGETFVSFTVPESNTTWKFRAIAYDKTLNIGSLESIAISRKELMVTPNLPRFMRQGDKTGISTKISNLSETPITGKVRIELFNPLTDKPIDININNLSQTFSIEKDASTSAEWIFDIPTNIDMIGCRIIAESESFSDGEQHVISVLPNRMLVTESLPMNVIGTGKKQFVLDKLANNQSASLSNYRLTLEYSSNPAWYAVQALPEFSNPTNENAVNWFASYYVNTLGGNISKQYPKVSSMIAAWKKQGESKESLMSKLLKNEDLKSVLLEETPWVLDAKDENEQIGHLSLLLDLNNTLYQQTSATNKLVELQNSDGGWAWYKGFRSNINITQYILYGYSQLVNLNAVEYPAEVKVMQMNALKYIDNEIKRDFDNLQKYNKNWEKQSTVSTYQLEYAFVRSGYRDIPIDQEARKAERFYTTVAEKNWTKLSLYEQALLIVIAKRNGNNELANTITKSLHEYATIDSEKGMFWANNKNNVFMSLSAISTHVFLMKAFQETGASEKEMNLMKLWLLKQKQVQKWESTHASMDAIYALLSTGSDWFSNSGDVTIKVGEKEVNQKDKQIGSGYFKEIWTKDQINKQMANVEVENKNDIPSFGAIYWQYYEDMGEISSLKSVLNVDKSLFKETVSEKGKSLSQITNNNLLSVGDKVIVRLTVRVDRDMEFVHLKDMRASCFEPISTISGTNWNENIVYYQSTKDASTNFYFDHLPKGTYVFEYPVYVTRNGEYSNGITTIQCLYAPEFISHTTGLTIKVQ